MTGLRERKKQRTRDALLRAANELFVSRGYEETTVDEIAAAVDVSQRTFFRYFSGKDEAAFAIQMMVEERYIEALRARPAHEAPVVALRQAVEDGWNGISEAIERIVPIELHMRMWHQIETTPVLTASHMRRSLEMEQRLAQIIADREGLDPRTDPRPRVLVAAFSAVIHVAMHQWAQGEEVTLESARQDARRCLDELNPELFAEWGGTRAAAEPRRICRSRRRR
ncbi:TetR family transcriptional regulator [Streptomyces sp. JJ38]|uniref:TetR family transcriptional regulator n=1 Tax=Streptomyces sp. JJ38 TaxID=2738128 RepID=UPI001C59A869|nr:TetR family transcriptional regulator [Streptomyces sp. JJ38]MBW1599022.1 TetR family transcriptional regulator [Streptomyces sp. JJ38]